VGKLQRRLEGGLKLWIRQLAWLHATPRPDARTKRAQNEPDEPVSSRIEQMRRQRIAPAMPPNPAPHITDWLLEIGLTEAAGMGAAPLSWRELDAWCDRTGVNLDPWESRLIRRLSSAYIAEGQSAESENCPPPWRIAVTARERNTEAARLRLLLG
jgi:hypothetical protein